MMKRHDGSAGGSPVIRKPDHRGRGLLVISVCLLVMLLAVSGLLAQEVTNKTCPVLTGEKVDPSIWVEYKGKKVFFCCPMCRKNFLADPEAYTGNLPQFNKEAASREGGIGSDRTSSGKGEGEKLAGKDSDGTSPSPGNGEIKHEHEESGHDQAEAGTAVTLLGKFHPVVIHFPIALILTAALAELLAILRHRSGGGEVCKAAVRYLLPLAALSAIVAVLLGLAAEDSMRFPDVLQDYVEWHETMGLVTAGLVVITAFMHEWNHRVAAAWRLWSYRAAMFLTSACVIVTGHLGGILVFGPNHFSI